MSKISKNPNPLHTQQNRFAKHLTYFAKRFMISTVGVSMTVTTDGAKLTPTVARAAVISAFGRVVKAEVSCDRTGRTYRVTAHAVKLISVGYAYLQQV